MKGDSTLGAQLLHTGCCSLAAVSSVQPCLAYCESVPEAGVAYHQTTAAAGVDVNWMGTGCSVPECLDGTEDARA